MVSRNLSNILFGSGVALTMGLTAAAPAKAWTPLMPDVETAIDVTVSPSCDNLTGGGIDPDSIYGVKSISSVPVPNYEGNPAEISSCLVADVTTTATVYPGFTLVTPDAGTNDKAGDIWYRPIARNSADVAEEAGRLEYGTFDFVLDDDLVAKGGKLRFTFLDIEGSKPTTGIKVGDTFYNAFTDGTYVGGNDKRYELVLNMVSAFTVIAGSDTSGFGDGVNFRVEAKTPEPSAMLGLGLAVGALATARKRRAEND